MPFRPKEIFFDKEKGTLLLTLSDKDVSISEFVVERAKQDGLEKEKEFHITIFGFSLGQRILKSVGDKNILESLLRLANETSWAITPTEEIYKISKTYSAKTGGEEHRESLILMVKLEGLEDFVQKAVSILKMNIEVPPAHVTLFSKSDIKENMLSGIGVNSKEDMQKLHPMPVLPMSDKKHKYKIIALPTRAQPDTIIAIFILKKFGEEIFHGISKATYEVLPRFGEGETDASMAKKGVLLLDVGGGVLDHHSKSVQTTASALVSDYLSVRNNPALSKLLQFAERDDFYGKGIISNDPLDRAFGLSGLIGSLNKKYVNEPQKVIEIILPIIDAFYTEEEKRAFEMPKELQEKFSSGKAHEFSVRQRGRVLKCIFIETDNASMAGFLRSKSGGGYDVVALRLSSGHINILTKPQVKPDLRSLVVLIRIQEAEVKKLNLPDDPEKFSKTGTLAEIPEWYYDPATNSLLNGGPNPGDLKATSIDPFEFRKLLEIGLSEQLWRPSN